VREAQHHAARSTSSLKTCSSLPCGALGERVVAATELTQSRRLEQRALAVVTCGARKASARPSYFRPFLATTQSALLEPRPWERTP
jgi:hypothetical protein